MDEKGPAQHSEHLHQDSYTDGVKEDASIDAVHNDKGMKVFSSYTRERTWSRSEEKALLRKIDWKVMPLLFSTYGLQFYDKAMLSQAVSLSCYPSVSGPMCSTNEICPGVVRAHQRPRTHWKQIQLLILHILPRLCCRDISSHVSDAAFPRATCRSRDHSALGLVSKSHGSLPQLQATVHPAIFPRILGGRSVSNGHGDCVELLYKE